MHGMKLGASLATLVGLACVAAGCHGSHAKDTAATSTAAVSSAGHALVAAVLGSPRGPGFGFFPSRVGAKRCTIPEGGPAGLRISGICSARVSFRAGGLSGQALVVLTETWPWRSFHYAGSPRRAQRHSWSFFVLPSRRVVALGQHGDFPPQNAR